MQKLQRTRSNLPLCLHNDLSMVKYISDRIGVMHWGKMLELERRMLFTMINSSVHEEFAFYYP